MGGVKTHRGPAPAGGHVVTAVDQPGKSKARSVSPPGGGRAGAGPGGVGRQAEVAQDALHNGRVLDRRDETEPTAAGARENVDLKNAAQQVGPRERATTRRCGRWR